MTCFPIADYIIIPETELHRPLQVVRRFATGSGKVKTAGETALDVAKGTRMASGHIPSQRVEPAGTWDPQVPTWTLKGT